MTVKIICDTSADLNLTNDTTLYEKYDIEWVPMNVMFGTTEYKELVDLKPSGFYKLIHESTEHPTTSQSTQHELLTAYDKHGSKYDEIISIHISSALSGAYANAMMAKKMYKRKNPDGAEIHVFDSKQASVPYGLIAIKASQLAKQGLNAEAIIEKLTYFFENDDVMYFTVKDIKWLFEGGRLSRAKYVLGKMLNVNPILTLIDGKIESVGKGSGLEKALDAMLEMAIDNLDRDVENITIHFVEAETRAEVEKFIGRFKEKYPSIKVGEIFTLGGTICAHTGPGTIVLIGTRNFEY
ncbi:MAG: DegV family protein [Candidatus Heimdallarchaeota archaeon]|nr:DegV family protein [Candidatus Heimdallarchaeota archaeon]